MPRSILLIEDAPEDQQVVCDALQDCGYSVSTISDPQHALATVND